MDLQNRKVILDKINAANLVPIAVANAMLFVGSNMKPVDCQFELSTYFVITGTPGIIIAIFGQLSKLLIRNISDALTPCEYHILYIIIGFNDFLRFSELFALCGGVVLVLWHASRVVFNEEEQYEKPGLYFCKRGPFIFAAVFLSLVSIILAMGALMFFAGLVREVTLPKNPQIMLMSKKEEKSKH